MTEINVLNHDQNSEIPETLSNEGDIFNISTRLQKFMLQIKGDFMTGEGKSLDYDGIRSSQVFIRYIAECSRLVTVDLASLSESERIAFFINIYNSLTIHGICEQALPSSVLDVKDFWKNTAYNIGGHVFSLDDIEHGILRGNRPHPSSPNPLFDESDPRLQYIVVDFDPRIHFALVCGAKSCPAINVYSTKNLERGLQAATDNFCSQEVHVDIHSKKVTLSKIFQWYKKDFAEKDIDLLIWIQRNSSGKVSADLKQLVTENHDDVTLVYSNYNWGLNTVKLTNM